MRALILTGAAASAMLLAQPNVRIVTSDASPGLRPLTVEFIGSDTGDFSGKAVKGLPYAAEAVSEATQVLADGNRISRKSATAVYRDSHGRTRSEIAMPAVGPWSSGKAEKMVSILDPVSKTSIVLHPDKTAAKHALPQGVEGAGGDARTMIVNRRVESAKEFHTIENVVIERGEKIAAEAAHSARATGQSRQTESLGRKMIEGVEAEGTRVTSRMEAGEIGNERAIEVVDETWYSKEIEALVYSRHSDPRTGEATYRLINIQRGEQPIHLFDVPADFKLLENGPARTEIRIRKPANE